MDELSDRQCCRSHATGLNKVNRMYVCPECGDKRCRKAEFCYAVCANGGVHPDDKALADKEVK